MSGAIPPIPQYEFMAWCSVKKSTGTTLHLPFTFMSFILNWSVDLRYEMSLKSVVATELQHVDTRPDERAQPPSFVSISCTLFR
jgi:hypothetical protein